MRLWSIHPRYLDPAGLCGLWREALLAQRVVEGRTLAYRRHPQVCRLLQEDDPPGAMHAYLQGVWEEGDSRGYCLDRARITPCTSSAPMAAPQGQLEYELVLLALKLRLRNPAFLDALPRVEEVEPHPSIRPVPGGAAWWERPRPAVEEFLESAKRSPLSLSQLLRGEQTLMVKEWIR